MENSTENDKNFDFDEKIEGLGSDPAHSSDFKEFSTPPLRSASGDAAVVIQDDGWPVSLEDWLKLPMGSLQGPPVEPPSNHPKLTSTYEFRLLMDECRIRTKPFEKMLIVSAYDGTIARDIAEHFGSSATVTNSDKQVIDTLNAEPMRSAESVDRIWSMEKSVRRRVINENPHRAYRYVHASPYDTDLPELFDCVMVEQAHHLDQNRLSAKLSRVLRPGGSMVFVDYMLPLAIEPVNDIITMILEAVYPSLNQAERDFVDARVSSMPGLDQEEILLRGNEACLDGKLSLKEFLGIIESWPVVRRLSWSGTIPWEYYQLIDALKVAWGPVKSRRKVTVPVTIRFSKTN